MKGVNKLVMEVRPESEYFDKAILFLKPEKSDHPQKDISDSAEKLLNDIKTHERTGKPSPIWLLFAGITAGSVISWSIVFIIGLL